MTEEYIDYTEEKPKRGRPPKVKGLSYVGHKVAGRDFRVRGDDADRDYLVGADFTGCDLTGCNFQGLNLEGAVFAECTGITEADFKWSTWGDDTPPEGVNLGY